ncbi:MAG: hypothetical protein QOG47_1616, partial [Mycobacterium sp.]|nr:hypothetical protein [Mycobacterium sp.]
VARLIVSLPSTEPADEASEAPAGEPASA